MVTFSNITPKLHQERGSNTKNHSLLIMQKVGQFMKEK